MAQRRVDRKKELFWRRVVRGHERSGLTVRAWCRRHDLKEAAFHWWRRELARRDGVPKLVPVQITADAAQATCWPDAADPLHGWSDREASEAPIEIILTDGRRVRLRGPVDRTALRDVLLALTPGMGDAEGRPC